jgi:hypothetical protein
MLKRSARKTTINSEVKDAGGEEAYRAHQAKRKAKRKAEEESKRKLHALEKEEAHARALLWLKQKNEQGEQDARDMVAKVLETLALPRMKEKCLDSIASGPPHVQGSAQVVRNYGKRKVKQGTRFYFVDMEGRGDEFPPYSLTVAGHNFVKTCPMNPSPLVAGATLEDCKVYPQF